MPDRGASIDSQTLPRPHLNTLYTCERHQTVDFDRLSLSEFPSPPSTVDLGSESSTSNVAYDVSRQNTKHASTLNMAVTMQITLEKNADGTLRYLKLHDDDALQSPLIHSFPYSTSPTPHVEQPYQPDAKGPFVTSFLGEQIVQTAQVIFSAQPHYSFGDWGDCVAFQQALFGEELIFIAGVLKAKSKGRGEECVSQNLRLVRSKTGQRTLLLFANAQRTPHKQYVFIPEHAIDELDRHKRFKDRVTLKFVPNSTEILTDMKNLTVDFFEASDKAVFLELMG